MKQGIYLDDLGEFDAVKLEKIK